MTFRALSLWPRLRKFTTRWLSSYISGKYYKRTLAFILKIRGFIQFYLNDREIKKCYDLHAGWEYPSELITPVIKKKSKIKTEWIKGLYKLLKKLSVSLIWLRITIFSLRWVRITISSASIFLNFRHQRNIKAY